MDLVLCLNRGQSQNRDFAPSLREQLYNFHINSIIASGHFPNRYNDPYYGIRVNYLSNPNVEFQGVKTGSLTADNARVLTETRFRSAAVGDESAIVGEY